MHQGRTRLLLPIAYVVCACLAAGVPLSAQAPQTGGAPQGSRSAVAAAATKWDRPDARPAADALPEIAANTNRAPAGEWRDAVLSIALEARNGLWYPEENDGPGLEVQAFAESGKPLQIPGPLIRVPAGSEIRATVRNAIPGATLVVRGLHTRPGEEKDTLVVPSGETREVRFTAGAPGTYFYWATTTGRPFLGRIREDSQLTGALIVDPPGAPRAANDRIFVIGLWSELEDPTKKPTTNVRTAFVINGRSWPHTERLDYTAGDTVRWRVINGTLAVHPMHLHGYYYRVESTGDAERDTPLAEAEQRWVVTERMSPGETMAVSWFPTRAGNWLFHCHVIPHISPELRIGRMPAGTSSHGEMQHAVEGMAGLVLGLRVLPARNAPPPAPSKLQPRRLRLRIEELPGRYGKDSGYGFALEDGRAKGAPAAAQIPGPPIVLTRGQPVSITVVNRLREGTAIHWHGVELQSFYDGVPGLSGEPGRIAPPIPPGESIAAEYTPPRAGTFIYHSHMDDLTQLSSGLYGALIVLEPGQRYEPETDRPMILSVAGPDEETAPVLLNGRTPPEPLTLRAGAKYRFRFINITPHDPRLEVALLSGTEPVRWRAISKDGAALPASQATLRPAKQIISVGETYDFEFEAPAPAELRLEIFRPRVLFRPDARYTTPVHVR